MLYLTAVVWLIVSTTELAFGTVRKPYKFSPGEPQQSLGPARSASWSAFVADTIDAGDIMIQLYGGLPGHFNFEFPRGSRVEYLAAAGIWVGAVRETDTLVSQPHEFNSYAPIRKTTSRRNAPNYDPSARGEQQLYVLQSDTGQVGDDVDEIDLRRHQPIGLEISQTTYGWSDAFSKRFVIVDSWIRNVSTRPVSKASVGLYIDADVYYRGHDWPSGRPTGYHQDDIVGMLTTVPGIVPGTRDSVWLAWYADNDGDPWHGTFDLLSQIGVMGVRVLRAPVGGQFSFNWWVYDGSSDVSWGPRPLGACSYQGACGWPVGDRAAYRMMINHEIDYDQLYAAIDHTAEGWGPPPSGGDAAEIASGYDVYSVASYGPLPDIPPGDSVPFTFAFIAGSGFHTDPRNFADRFDPSNPQPYLDHLSFTDLITNARWADWVFDNPGVDTDHDGNRGRAYLVNCNGVDSTGCDSVFYKGDGVPDWKGPQAPTPPRFELSTKPGQAILRWNGAFTEIERDPLSRKWDFEGYRVYVGRFATDDQLSLIASWDREDFKRLAYQQATGEWRQVSDPLTTDQWRRLLGNPAFDPKRYAVPSPNDAYRDSFWDTTRNTTGEIVSVQQRERWSYWAPEAANRANRYLDEGRSETNIIQRVAQRDTVVGGEPLVYGVYEVTIDNLQPSVPLYFAVATFDFGDFEKNVDPMESSPANNSQYGEPIYSASVVADSGIHVSVYPNPYKIIYDDAFGNRATYFMEGYEGYGHPEMTEHDRRIHFINLPDTATIRIYSLFGDLIREIHHPDQFLTTYSSSVGWDLITRNAQAVTSGIYIYRVDSKLGSQIGKIVIIK